MASSSTALKITTVPQVTISNSWTFYYNGIFKRKDRGKDPQEILFDKIPSQIILPNKTSVIGKRITSSSQLLENERNVSKELDEDDGSISLSQPPLVVLPCEFTESEIETSKDKFLKSLFMFCFFDVLFIVGLALYSSNISLLIFQLIFLASYGLGVFGIYRKRFAYVSVALCFLFMHSTYFLLLFSKVFDLILGFSGYLSLYYGREFMTKSMVVWFLPATPQ